MDFYTVDFQYIWERDIPNFVYLNVNAVRIYAVDPSKNHDAFMCMLKQYGIYVIIGLAADCFECAISGDSAPACYSQNLLDRGEYIVQQFSRYTNVIGFDAGNEVSLRASNEVMNGPCQKQFLRDMRAYVKDCVSSNSMRHIPIGLAVADIDRSYKALYYKYVFAM
jgi:1,3-beta-glucanosyltransferase GAS5